MSIGTPSTPLWQKTIEMAREEAIRWRHHSIGAEHLLLGMLRTSDDDPRLEKVLIACDPRATVEEIRRRVEFLLVKGIIDPVPPLPFTQVAKKAVIFAMEARRAYVHESLDSLHLLLGLTREIYGVACAVLDSVGVDDEALLKVLSDPSMWSMPVDELQSPMS